MICLLTLPSKGSPIQKPVNRLAFKIKQLASTRHNTSLESIFEPTLISYA